MFIEIKTMNEYECEHIRDDSKIYKNEEAATAQKKNQRTHALREEEKKKKSKRISF